MFTYLGVNSATLLGNKLNLLKLYSYHIKNDRNISGDKTVIIIIKPSQLCAYKAPVGSRRFKLHF